MARRRRQRTKSDGIDLIHVRALISEGKTDTQIAAEMRETMSDVVAARRKIIAAGLLEVGPQRPVGEVYTEHRLRMMKVIDDLGDLADECYEEKPHITLGALKAQASISDRLLERGQELGVLPRAARQSSTQVAVAVVGVRIGGMTDPELAEHLGELNREGSRLRDSYQEVPFLDLGKPDVYPEPDVIDADDGMPEPVHVQRRKA